MIGLPLGAVVECSGSTGWRAVGTERPGAQGVLESDVTARGTELVTYLLTRGRGGGKCTLTCSDSDTTLARQKEAGVDKEALIVAARVRSSGTRYASANGATSDRSQYPPQPFGYPILLNAARMTRSDRRSCRRSDLESRGSGGRRLSARATVRGNFSSSWPLEGSTSTVGSGRA